MVTSINGGCVARIFCLNISSIIYLDNTIDLFNRANLVLGARSKLNGFAGKDCELFWSTGVLEYWSVGKSENPNLNLNESFHYSISPADAAKGKAHLIPLRGQPKADSFGPGFFN
jgi:hypothetical protein